MSVGVVCQPFHMSSDRCHSYPTSTFGSTPSIISGSNDNFNKVFADEWGSTYDGASNSEHTASPYINPYPVNQFRTSSVPTVSSSITFRQPFDPSPSFFTVSSTAGPRTLSDHPQPTVTYSSDVSTTRCSSVTADNPDVSYSPWVKNELSRGKSPKDMSNVYTFGSPRVATPNPVAYNPLYDPLYDVPIMPCPQSMKPLPSQPLENSAKPSNTSRKRSYPDGTADHSADGSTPPFKRRKESLAQLLGSPGLSSAALGVEDSLLLKSRDEEQLSWKMVAVRFQKELGRNYNVPALQMRLKRLRERLRAWVEVDVTALKLAHEYWEKNRWEIIADKMLEFGALERWTPQNCVRKWTELSSEMYERASSVATINDVVSNPETVHDRSESHQT